MPHETFDKFKFEADTENYFWDERGGSGKPLRTMQRDGWKNPNKTHKADKFSININDDPGLWFHSVVLWLPWVHKINRNCGKKGHRIWIFIEDEFQRVESFLLTIKFKYLNWQLFRFIAKLKSNILKFNSFMHLCHACFEKTFLLFYLRFISRNKSHLRCKTEKFSFLFITRIKAKSFIVSFGTELCFAVRPNVEASEYRTGRNWNGCKIERTMKRRRRERWSINDSYDRWIRDEALALNIKTFSIRERQRESTSLWEGFK